MNGKRFYLVLLILIAATEISGRGGRTSLAPEPDGSGRCGVRRKRKDWFERIFFVFQDDAKTGAKIRNCAFGHAAKKDRACVHV